MAKVYTVRPGAAMRIGNYGEATNDTPALVPDEVAREFSGRDDLRVETDVVVIPPGSYSRESLEAAIHEATGGTGADLKRASRLKDTRLKDTTDKS